MLVRSNLSMDAIALAVCILDSLNSKFSLNWRLLCPLAQHEPVNEITKRHTIQARPAGTTQLHIDSVNPEVIILAALIIASKFLADCQEPTNYYRSAWGQNMWTCDQINVTERCIMESLGYRILPLWDPVLIADAVNDMQRAAKQAARRPQPRSGEAHKRSASSAVVLSGPCLPLTPAETPVLEDGPTLTPVREAAGAGFGGEGLVPVDASMLDSQQCAKRKRSLQPIEKIGCLGWAWSNDIAFREFGTHLWVYGRAWKGLGGIARQKGQGMGIKNSMGYEHEYGNRPYGFWLGALGLFLGSNTWYRNGNWDKEHGVRRSTTTTSTLGIISLLLEDTGAGLSDAHV
jgi:hypothetical protein